MIEVILGIAALALLGYFAFKIFVKHETPLEAITEIKDEIAYEAKHLEVTVEHKLEDTLHSLEEKVAARARTAEAEEKGIIVRAKFNEDHDKHKAP